MQLSEYLNQLDSSNDLMDYKYGMIYPETVDLSDSDKEALELVLDIIRLNENYRKKDEIFIQGDSKRLPELKNITKEDLTSVLSLNLTILPRPICARIADFLWTTIKDYKSAQIAIQTYLELYELTWDEDHWPDCIDAVYRAVNIAQSYNKKGKEYKECIEAVRRGLDRSKGNDRLYLSSYLLEILAEQKQKMDADIQQYARNAIEAAKRDQNFAKAQDILETLVKFDPENRNSYYEEAGDITQAFAFNPAIRRVHILNQALQYFKKAGAEEKQRRCRELIEEAQSHILEEMQLIKTDPIDISSTVKEVLTAIRKAESIKQSIITFGDLVHIYKREELLKYVKDDGISAALFSSAMVDHKGRQIVSLPPLPLDEELNVEDERVQSHMWDKARWLQELNADLVLKYAYEELNNLYQYQEEDLDFLVNDNAIIPKGRENIIRKGIFLGMQGDIYAALHILLPQTENIIRFVVELCGGKTFYFHTNDDVDDHLLGPLLESSELNECYDPDIIFCLRGLLDKKEGSNLRNAIAHGFMEPGNSKIGLYFLGFVIKFLSWYSVSCWEERQIMKDKEDDPTRISPTRSD